MKQTNTQKLFISLIGILFLLPSCSKDSDGDDYTPAKKISLGEISIMVPETYISSGSSGNSIEYSNDFGGGAVELQSEAVNGRTQDEVFNYKSNAAGYKVSTDTTSLQNHQALIIEENIGNIHRMVHYVFIHNSNVYTIIFSWTIEKETNSRKSMQAMLATLSIG